MKNWMEVSYDATYRKIFACMNEYCRISEELIEEIWERGRLLVYKKGEVIISEGERSKNLFFVVDGFCSCYYMKDGREHILRFISGGEFCLLHHGFLGDEENLFNVKATEKTLVLCISREDYKYLWDHYPDFVRLTYSMLKQYAIDSELHYYRIRSTTAEERIRMAINTREIQTLIKHVPQYCIASYLNMAPETYAKLIAGINRY